MEPTYEYIKGQGWVPVDPFPFKEGYLRGGAKVRFEYRVPEDGEYFEALSKHVELYSNWNSFNCLEHCINNVAYDLGSYWHCKFKRERDPSEFHYITVVRID